MQKNLVAGDTLNFATTTIGYSAADGWLLKYRLVPISSLGTPINIDAVADGSDHRVQVAPSDTAQWAPGAYSWTSWVERGGETYTLESGQIAIAPDPRTVAAGYDNRSLAVRTLADLKAARAQFLASNGMTRSYKIADRERVYASGADILTEIRFWEAEVQKEEQAAARACGKSTGGRFYVRQTR